MRRAVLLAALPAIWTAAPAAARTGLLDPTREGRMLVDAPGAAGSLGAAFLNPAAAVAQGQVGFFGALSDEAGGRFGEGDVSAHRPWAALATWKYATLGARRLRVGSQAEDAWVDEYTAALAAGNRSLAFGLLHAWNREGDGANERHRYLLAGAVRRWRSLSLGTSAGFDLEDSDRYAQADVGVRPLGPRWTLWADAQLRRGQRAADLAWGGGLDCLVLPGLRIGARVDEQGAFGLSFTLGAAGRLRAGARFQFDETGTHVFSAGTIERGSWQPPVGHGRLGRAGTYRRLALAGPFTHQRFRLFDRRKTLLGALRAVNACADDPRAAGAVVDLSGAALDGATAWELRAQLAGLRARGKKVVVYADRLGIYGLMLASVADQLWLDPQGGLTLRGLTIGRTYYADALAKAGVGFDELRFFTYKSAAEIGARNAMSPADREQRQALVDDAYATVAALVAQGRGIDRESWDRWIDGRAEFSPDEALALGLIDSVGTLAQAFKSAPKAPRRAVAAPALGTAPGPGVVSASSAPGPDAEDAGAVTLAGVVGDPAQAALAWGEPERVAVLYAAGDCAMESGIRGPVLAAAVKRAREDGRVKAVVLRVDSPGGERLPSDLVTRELIATAAVKPVIVSQGSVAASGGYYLSMEADTIVASPLTRTGSIGVISAHAWDQGLGARLGLAYAGVRRGAHADYLSGWRVPLMPAPLPHRAMRPEERARAESLIRTMYAEFVARVAAARGRPEGEIEALAQGRVWSGARARDHGLVDVEGGLWEALRLARARAGLPVDRPVALAEGPEPEWINPGLYDVSVIPELGGRAERHYLEMLLRHAGEPLMLAAPDDVSEAP